MFIRCGFGISIAPLALPRPEWAKSERARCCASCAWSIMKFRQHLDTSPSQRVPGHFGCIQGAYSHVACSSKSAMFAHHGSGHQLGKTDHLQEPRRGAPPVIRRCGTSTDLEILQTQQNSNRAGRFSRCGANPCLQSP